MPIARQRERPIRRSAGTAVPARRRILLIDDHPLVREGLGKVIEQEPDLAVCGHAEDPAGAYAAVVQERPDAIIVDLSLRGGSGLDLIKQIQQLPGPPAILVLSMHDEALYADRAIRAGALGYVMKRESSGRIIEALRRVLAGKLFLSEAVSARALQKFFDGGSPPGVSTVKQLSDRELDIFRRLGQGAGTRQIASELRLSIKTVQTHCAHIKEKLGFENGTTLMLEAVRWVERGMDESGAA